MMSEKPTKDELERENAALAAEVASFTAITSLPEVERNGLLAVGNELIRLKAEVERLTKEREALEELRELTPEQWQEFYERVWDTDEADPVLELSTAALQGIGLAMLATIRALPLAPLAPETDSVHLVSAEREPSVERGLMAAPQWISVKERLPEENEKVLIFGHAFERVSVGWMERWSGVCWYSATEQVGDEGCPSLQRVTHWMALPEPPK